MSYLGRPGATAPLTSADIPDNSITAAKIVDATIAAGDLANDVVIDTSGAISTSGTATFSGDLVPSTPLSHRNMVINGAMNVAQRGDDGGGATGYTCADRFKRVASNNGVVTTARVSEAPVGFENSYKVTITSADTSITSSQYEFHEQQIEGINIYHLEWGTSDAKTVTLCFYVRSSLAGVFGGSIRNSANQRAYSFEYTIDIANTWERKIITIAGDTTGTWLKSNLAGLKIEWTLGSGSSFHGSGGWETDHFLTKDVARSNDSADALLATVNATWQITGVQLELGSSATPFEHRSYADELLRCQRYYQRNGGDANMALASGASISSSGVFAQGNLVCPMRGTISMTFDTLWLYGSQNSNMASGSLDYQHPSSTCIGINASSASTPFDRVGEAQMILTNSDAGYMAFDAEID